MSNETTIMFQHETDHRMMIPAVLGFPMCRAEFMCFDRDIYIFVHLSAILPISCYIHHSIGVNPVLHQVILSVPGSGQVQFP